MFVFNQFNVIKNGGFSSSMGWWIVKAICKRPEADQHHLWVLHRLNPLKFGVDWKDLVQAHHKKQQVGLVKWQKESDIPLQILHLHYHRLQLTLRYLLDQEDQEEQKHFRIHNIGLYYLFDWFQMDLLLRGNSVFNGS